MTAMATLVKPRKNKTKKQCSQYQTPLCDLVGWVKAPGNCGRALTTIKLHFYSIYAKLSKLKPLMLVNAD